MLKQLNRYEQPEVIAHLASQFVLGVLPQRVHRRVNQLRIKNSALEQAIDFWQNRLIDIDIQTDERVAMDDNWQKITNKLGFEETQQTINSRSQAPEIDKSKVEQIKPAQVSFAQQLINSVKRFLSHLMIERSVFSPAFSILLVVLVSYVGYNTYVDTNANDPLSYVAVLTDENQQAQLVASTYGQSKKLIINVVGQPTITAEQSLELWVISKTDGMARSLGLVSTEQTLVEKQLSIAQWRLIKDSHSLIVTIEELDGSAIGEPSELIVSRGLCVRLAEWDKNGKV